LQGQGRGQTGLPFQHESGRIKHHAGAQKVPSIR
jgi:hypothetical protein